MILILNQFRNTFHLVALCAVAVLLVPVCTYAQTDGIRITVAPTLIEMNVTPGEIWRSSLKVVNSNDFPLTLFVAPAHFESVGENGQSTIIPVSEIPEDETSLLATWLTAEQDTVSVSPGDSVQVPFMLEVPESAAPGSYFAAMQVSTVPPPQGSVVGLQTAQVISSLLFVRVDGDDVQESAQIRSFTASDSFSVTPSSDLTVRFENTGNVHLRPVGQITIKNMWGMERGIIPVNTNTSFGNALPNSIRRYEFSWNTEPTLFDIGVYTAEVALAYGYTDKQFATSTTRFWVIPVKAIVYTLLIIAIIIGLIIFVSRWYIKLLLAQAGVTSLESLKNNSHRQSKNTDSTALDLSRKTYGTSPSPNTGRSYILLKTLKKLVRTCTIIWDILPQKVQYSVITVFILLMITGLLIQYQMSQRTPSYEATILSGANSVTYNAEEIAFFQKQGRSALSFEHDDSTYTIVIINASQTLGKAGELADRIVDRFPVVDLGVSSETTRRQTVIVFPPDLETEALELVEVIPGALLSATSEATSTITIFVGNNL